MIKAAGIMFMTDAGETLLLKRSDAGDFGGYWDFPGGKIEDGETAEEAAVRECLEETGHVPDGVREVWTRRISEGVGGCDYTTFIQRIEKSYIPKLDGDHTAYTWVHVFDMINPKSMEPEFGPEVVR
jgi:8-oxo-dGTP pyrophosphatase MutT (NUDIX family)